MKAYRFSKLMSLAAIMSLLCACGSGRKSGNTSGELFPEPYDISFRINKLTSNDALAMSDVADSLEYVKLEIDPEHLIGNIIGRLYIDDNNILLYDGTLFQYTRQGKFVRQIGSIGRGPGEYLQLRGYWLDKDAGIIYTMPNYEIAVDRYDLASGKYLGKTQITESYGNPTTENDQSDLFPLSGNTMVWSRIGISYADKLPPHYAFKAINISSARLLHKEISKVYLDSGPSYLVAPTTIWYDDRGRMNFKEAIDNLVYLINPDFTMTLKATLDLSEGSTAAYFSETERYIFTDISYSGDFYAVAFDKSSGKSRLICKMSSTEYELQKHLFGLKNDMDGGFTLPTASGYDKDMWYTVFDAYKMIEVLTLEHFASVRSSMKYPDRLDRLQKFVSSLTEDDNPVIVIAHMK